MGVFHNQKKKDSSPPPQEFVGYLTKQVMQPDWGHRNLPSPPIFLSIGKYQVSLTQPQTCDWVLIYDLETVVHSFF